MPKVSVIMAVKNGERFLREAVESILVQTFTDFEFIIIDDGSADKTADMLKAFSYKDPRVKIITNAHNVGLTKSLNIGLRVARGEYIARMDADDVAMPERFEKQVKFLDEHADIGVVGAWAKVVDDSGVEVDRFDWETDARIVKKNLIKWNNIIHSLAMMRRSVIDKVGGYDESFQYAQDYDLWLRIAVANKLCNLPEFLLYYRMSNVSITANKNNKQALCALRARWNAIKRGQYSPFAIVYLLRPIASIVFSRKLKDFYK